MNPIPQLVALGQSLWYDNIQRRLLVSGELAGLVARGDIRGVTSNPSIFHNAIAGSNDYDPALVPMAWAGWDAETIFWQLAVEDIRQACDLFKPLYQATGGGDGYVSLEVHPALAGDGSATLAQARHLWERVSRPNLMIKIPATRAGLPAIRAAIAAGLNINVTLIFSIDRYREVMAAYLEGVEAFLESGGEAQACPASVASFFISRMDSKVDSLLPPSSPLRGRAAVANAKLAYALFRETFSGPRWDKLQKAGARFQRPLWASTSTKNPAYPDTMYVDSLVGPDTVNTLPPQTLEAYRHHGRAEAAIAVDLEAARQVFKDLGSSGISIDRVTDELEQEGVKAFADAFSAMLSAIEARRVSAVSSLGPLAGAVEHRLARLKADDVAGRLWNGDPSLWTSDPKSQEEIRKRLGWLRLPVASSLRLPSIQSVAAEVSQAGIRKVLLLGMGGSSLAPEVMSLVFKDASSPGGGPVRFAILDSTDPAQVRQAAMDFPPVESLYIVSSKSGGTAEVNAMLDYFWSLSGNDGSRFIAITDPGTSLDQLANARGFRHTLLADPAVGGRFSVLADFGLLPMALLGLDLEKALAGAASMMEECGPGHTSARNPGLALGAVLGEAALSGRGKLTLLVDPQVAAFGSWLEQLIAESSGKQGRGIVVVDGEPVGAPGFYGPDRLFVYLRAGGDCDQEVRLLAAAGHPVLQFNIPDALALVPEFYRWEVATAIACHILGVNAFDQPDVQDNKDRTLARMAGYQREGKLAEPAPAWESQGLKVFTNLHLPPGDLPGLLAAFLAEASVGDPLTSAGRAYIAINAYLPRTAGMLDQLTALRMMIRERTRCATTVGFGPRFLHSTGQLHKGGPASGLFLLVTADPVQDLEIPGRAQASGSPVTFGVLQRAQALGDYEALEARGRKILRIHLPSPQEIGLLVAALG